MVIQSKVRPNLAQRYQFRTLFITILRGRPHDQELAKTKTPGVSVDFFVAYCFVGSLTYILASSFYEFCLYVYVSSFLVPFLSF